MLDVAELTGGGGSERQFADLFDHCVTGRVGRHEVYFLTDRRSVRRLRQVGRLRAPRNLILLDGSGRSGGDAPVRAVRVMTAARRAGLDLVHVALPSPASLPFLWLCRCLSARSRPAITITVTDCTLAHGYFHHSLREGYDRLKVQWLYRTFFRTTALDGVYTWYRLFVERFSGGQVRGKPPIVAARYCFVDTGRFRPSERKRPQIVFASRLIETKRPLVFIDAIARAFDEEPDTMRPWKVRIYGGGPLERAVRSRIAQRRLSEVCTVGCSGDLADVFAGSRLYVSTQDFENFTSLSMLEAMAAGNAVIARNVGQTAEFVRDGRNGYLMRGDGSGALAAAIRRYARAPERHAEFARESRRIALEEHTIGNFVADIEAFWEHVVGQRSYTRRR